MVKVLLEQGVNSHSTPPLDKMSIRGFDWHDYYRTSSRSRLLLCISFCSIGTGEFFRLWFVSTSDGRMRLKTNEHVKQYTGLILSKSAKRLYLSETIDDEARWSWSIESLQSAVLCCVLGIHGAIVGKDQSSVQRGEWMNKEETCQITRTHNYKCT